MSNVVLRLEPRDVLRGVLQIRRGSDNPMREHERPEEAAQHRRCPGDPSAGAHAYQPATFAAMYA